MSSCENYLALLGHFGSSDKAHEELHHVYGVYDSLQHFANELLTKAIPDQTAEYCLLCHFLNNVDWEEQATTNQLFQGFYWVVHDQGILVIKKELY